MNFFKTIKNLQQKYRTQKSSKDFYKMCNTYQKTLKKDHNVDVYFDKDISGGHFSHGMKSNKDSIVIGMKDVEQFGFCGTNYDEINFVGTMETMLHEFRHSQQQKAMQGPSTDPRVANMAKSTILAHAIPEFYQCDYFNDPCELDAQYWSMQQGAKLQPQVCPHINIDEYHKEVFNTNYVNHIGSFYLDRPVMSGRDGMRMLRNRIDNPDTIPAYKNMDITLPNNGEHSPLFSEFASDKNRLNALNNCKTAQEQKEMLTQFVYQKDPELFKPYKSLDQWTKTQDQQKTQTKTITQQTKHTPLPTMEEIEARQQNFASQLEASGNYTTSFGPD